MRPTFDRPNAAQFLVAPKPYIFGFSRMFQTLGDDLRPNLAVISDIEEAYTALKLSRESLARVASS